MRRLRLSLLALLLLLVLSGPAFYLWEANRNRGFTWGYYGDFNTLSNALAGLPKVTISNSYHLEEIHGLELVTFDLIVAGQSTHLRFPQDDPIRELRATALTNALIQRIAEQKSNLSNLNRPRFGVIELYREEANGSVNILPCTVILSDVSQLNL